MTNFLRTPDDNFVGLQGYDFEPHYHQWQDLRVHYLDEGPRDGPVLLLLHGMPTWSYLYRDVIPPLVAAGYRCIAPDHLGFGRSDKPTDIHWYTIARHVEVLTSLIQSLDLQKVTLVCQDWGGPTGLAQAAQMPERFDRLVIMNTWLHHDAYVYSEAIHRWNRSWQPGGAFQRECPDVGLLMLISANLLSARDAMTGITGGTVPALTGAAKAMHAAYIAPFREMPEAAYNGLRRFPLCIPLDGNNDSHSNGNAAAQALHYRTLLQFPRAVHFIWGCADDIFTEQWGRHWAEQMGASFDPISEAGHFLQNTHGAELSSLLLERLADE